jgi:hypothetical protein
MIHAQLTAAAASHVAYDPVGHDASRRITHRHRHLYRREDDDANRNPLLEYPEFQRRNLDC